MQRKVVFFLEPMRLETYHRYYAFSIFADFFGSVFLYIYILYVIYYVHRFPMGSRRMMMICAASDSRVHIPYTSEVATISMMTFHFLNLLKLSSCPT